MDAKQTAFACAGGLAGQCHLCCSSSKTSLLAEWQVCARRHDSRIVLVYTRGVSTCTRLPLRESSFTGSAPLAEHDMLRVNACSLSA